jgi:hypothetical protein
MSEDEGVTIMQIFCVGLGFLGFGIVFLLALGSCIYSLEKLLEYIGKVVYFVFQKQHVKKDI